MNHHDDERIPLDEDSTLSDALRWQLRAQRRDIAPPTDLWAGIAARLETPAPRVVSRSRTPWYAMAASVLLAIGAGTLVQRVGVSPTDTVAHREAQTLTREYDRALRSMPADASSSTELAPAIAELDRSARQIRRALERDPDSRLLLDQLRRTYSLRLSLSQRAVVG
ncbi:hypothetical protein DWG18_04885 [Lysobacter sp. TY2-98]|uniref:hypothetical protein n=1 Tax=Lysobacter sp. TY2-98 TaxID=2290922 RepID=UPI000E20C6CE|nr:hypothetical protein [Lysobacter sp. TY2-98]AXK71691.1 hypothetical protein DWG18_04885 [Lysobacter sp. TY2-98]